MQTIRRAQSLTGGGGGDVVGPDTEKYFRIDLDHGAQLD